jgi:ankyrin repeat protein
MPVLNFTIENQLKNSTIGLVNKLGIKITPIYFFKAIKKDFLVDFFLESGTNLDQRDINGDTPLICAARYQSFHALRALKN